MAESWPAVARRLAMGGFPEALSRKDDERRAAWYSSYTTTILERDIRDLANIQSHRELPRLLRLIALRSGSLLDRERLVKDDLAAGPALETFVATELLKQMATGRTRATLFHYRTHKQQEVDLVLEDPRGRLVAIEVKKTASPTGGDLEGLRKMRAATGDRFLRGILLYLGGEWVAADGSIQMIPLPALWQAVTRGR